MEFLLETGVVFKEELERFLKGSGHAITLLRVKVGELFRLVRDGTIHSRVGEECEFPCVVFHENDIGVLGDTGEGGGAGEVGHVISFW